MMLVIKFRNQISVQKCKNFVSYWVEESIRNKIHSKFLAIIYMVKSLTLL